MFDNRSQFVTNTRKDCYINLLLQIFFLDVSYM